MGSFWWNNETTESPCASYVWEQKMISPNGQLKSMAHAHNLVWSLKHHLYQTFLYKKCLYLELQLPLPR